MKRTLFIVGTLMALVVCTDAMARPLRKAISQHFDAPTPGVCCELPMAEGYTSAVVKVAGKEVPSQVDSLPDVGRVVAFCYDAKQGTNKIRITYNTTPQKEYPQRVWAQMYYKNRDKSLRKIDYVEEGADTMYNRLHHHGPAFENEQVAYRLYFDKKQTVDIYGKRHPRLEIAKTMWYPTDEHLAEGAGDDVLRVSGTVGVGTLKGWNEAKGKATHIDKFQRRWARVISTGPVRTVVEMGVDGWDYCDRRIDLRSTYTLWAEGRECRVVHRFEGPWQGLKFCTGVQKKFRDRKPYNTDKALAVWAEDFPQNDTVKYKKERVGLVVWPKDGEPDGLPRVEDKDNYLCLVEPDENGEIAYTFAFVWLKEEFAKWDEEAFHAYVDSFKGRK